MMNLKRLLALLLCAIMALTIVGCSQPTGDTATAQTDSTDTAQTENTQEMITVSLHVPKTNNFSDEGVLAVQDAMNEHLAENYGIQVKLTYIDLGNWATQTNLALTTDECDVLPLMNSPLVTFVKNGQLTPLNDYFENSSDALKDTFSESEILATTYDGMLYSLPRKWWGGQESALFMSEAIVEELNIDPQSIDSIEKVDELLYQVKEAYPDIYTLVPGVEPSKLLDLWEFGDGMADERGRYGVVPMFDEDFDENNIQCKSVFDTDGFWEISRYAYKWYNDGLVLPDVLSNSIGGGAYIKNEEAFGFLVRQQGVEYKDVALTEANDTIPTAALIDSVEYSNINNVVSYGISSNSKNKDASWILLEALYTDGTLSTYLTNGLEGTNYVVAENGTAHYPEGLDPTTNTYSGISQFWTYPNPMISIPSMFVGPDFKEQAQAYADSLIISPIAGFKWDYEGLEDEMAAVSKIYDQYYVALISGQLNPEETIPMVLQELEQAGMNDILESQNEQIKEYFASK